MSKSTIDKVMDVQSLCILITRKTKRCVCKLVYNKYESKSRKTRNRERENKRNIHLLYYTNT